ncbi:MAG: hypothetical protein LKK12_09655 [Bacteroidales bacterium]|nr:hypothetical protein [Bacteroidales bacterium]MCI2134628.1 hypothetical protein [Bacteroidales bacterium]
MVEFRKVLSEYVLPEALQRGLLDNVALGRSRCRDMPFPTHFCAACFDSVLRDTSSERFEYPYAILYCFSFDKVL